MPRLGLYCLWKWTLQYTWSVKKFALSVLFEKKNQSLVFSLLVQEIGCLKRSVHRDCWPFLFKILFCYWWFLVFVQVTAKITYINLIFFLLFSFFVFRCNVLVHDIYILNLNIPYMVIFQILLPMILRRLVITRKWFCSYHISLRSFFFLAWFF